MSESIRKKLLKTLETLGMFALAGAVLCFVAVMCLREMDKHIYPGCTVIDQIGDHTLVIDLDDEIYNGSDGACAEAAKLILSICQDGWKVKVLDWNKTVDLQHAYELVELNGEPAPEEMRIQ